MKEDVPRRSGEAADLSHRSDEVAKAEADSDMTRTYVRVVIVEAIVIFCLWLLGRAFS
jgi:hypothetical protein